MEKLGSFKLSGPSLLRSAHSAHVLGRHLGIRSALDWSGADLSAAPSILEQLSELEGNRLKCAAFQTSNYVTAKCQVL